MIRRLVVLVSSAALGASLLTAGASYAVFSSTATSSGNTFQAGTLRVNLDKQDDGNAKRAYFTVSNMKPGDSQIQPIVINSNGSLGLQYTLGLSVAGALGSGAHPLSIALYPTMTDAQNGTNQIDLSAVKTMDAQDGTNHQQTYYVKVTMPMAAGNEYQGQTGTAVISVYANQLGAPAPGPENAGQGQQTGYTVTGTITGSNGKPGANGIYLKSSDGSHVYHESSVNGSTGAVRWTNIPDGTYTVMFDMSEYYPISPPVTVTVNGNNVSGVNIHVNAAMYSISGVAQDANGNPLGNEDIAVSDVPPGTNAYGNVDGWGLTTNSDGTFTVAGIPDGTYRLFVGLNWNDVDGADFTSTAKAYGEITVADGNVTGILLTPSGIEPTYSVSGTDLDSNGQLMNISQYLVDSHGRTYFIAKESSVGSFEYDNIPSGTYTITTKDGMYPITTPTTVTVTGANVPGLTVHYGVPTYAVQFKVQRNGAPFVGPVYIRDSSHTFQWGPYTPSQMGLITVSDVAPGTWELYTGPDRTNLTLLGTAQVTTTNAGSTLTVGD